jgi:hypothetical protein
VRADAVAVDIADLAALFEALKRRGYELIGPTLRDGAIAHAELTSIDDLPAGWTDLQDGGRYRLERRDDGAFYGYAVGQHFSFRKALAQIFGVGCCALSGSSSRYCLRAYCAEPALRV